MSRNHNRSDRPGKISQPGPQPGDRQFSRATPALIFNGDLTTTEVALLLAIGLYDWGDGRGGFPGNATLVKACRFKADGPDQGQKALRKLLARLKRDGYIRVETFPPTRENPTGRLIFLTEKSTGDQVTPGSTGPGVEPHPRVYRPGPPGHQDPAPPGLQAREIDSGEQTQGIDPLMMADGSAGSSSSRSGVEAPLQEDRPPASGADVAEVVAAAVELFPGDGARVRAAQLCREHGKAVALDALDSAKVKAQAGADVVWSYVVATARKTRQEGGAVGKARRLEPRPMISAYALRREQFLASFGDDEETPSDAA